MHATGKKLYISIQFLLHIRLQKRRTKMKNTFYSIILIVITLRGFQASIIYPAIRLTVLKRSAFGCKSLLNSLAIQSEYINFSGHISISKFYFVYVDTVSYEFHGCIFWLVWASHSCKWFYL